MKICMLSRVMPAHAKGGMQDHTMMLARGLVNLNHQVTVITTKHFDGKVYEEVDGVKIHYLPNTTPMKYNNQWWKESLNKTIELINEEKIDIIHSQSAGGYYLLKKRLNEKMNIPIVASLHGTTLDEIKTRINTGFSSFNPMKMAKSIAIILYMFIGYFRLDLVYTRRVNGLIATSDEQEEIIKKIYFVKPERLFKVYNGMDLSLFYPDSNTKSIREKLSLKDETKVVLSVSKLQEDKGVQNTIRAFPKVLQNVKDVKLVIVGDGYYRGYLENLVNQLGIKENVIFTGFVKFEELPSYFNLCDVFINATIRQNGYDLTMVEAMACEKVVVSSDIGSTRTLIKDNDDGILTPTGNIDILADKIIDLLNSPLHREEIGKRARIKVLTNFSLESMVENTVRVYEKVIERYK